MQLSVRLRVKEGPFLSDVKLPWSKLLSSATVGKLTRQPQHLDAARSAQVNTESLSSKSSSNEQIIFSFPGHVDISQRALQDSYLFDLILLLRGRWVKVFQSSPHQVEASCDEDVDFCCITERSSFGLDAWLYGQDGLGWVRQH